MTKKTEITIETSRVTIISKPTRMIGWCAECLKQVDCVTVDEAARLARKSSRDIFQMIEQREIYASETGDGILLVCPESLIGSKLRTEETL